MQEPPGLDTIGEKTVPMTTERNDALDACEDDNFSIIEGAEEPGKLAGVYDKQAFIDVRKRDMSSLVNNGTIVPTTMTNMPTGTRTFGSKFLDELKLPKECLKRKSRLVAEGYSHQVATAISPNTPTMEKWSQRMIMELALSIHGTRIFGHDITRAYIHSGLDVERNVFRKVPRKMVLPSHTVLPVVKRLYCLPEAVLHWYVTYLSHHIDELGMNKSRLDLCVLIKREN